MDRSALLRRIRERAESDWQAYGEGSTHWPGCAADHPVCRTLWLLAEVERLEAECERLRGPQTLSMGESGE